MHVIWSWNRVVKDTVEWQQHKNSAHWTLVSPWSNWISVSSHSPTFSVLPNIMNKVVARRMNCWCLVAVFLFHYSKLLRRSRHKKTLRNEVTFDENSPMLLAIAPTNGFLTSVFGVLNTDNFSFVFNQDDLLWNAARELTTVWKNG